MSRIGRIARSILVWSHERGTLPYDIICALILAFIFFVPRTCFVPKKIEYINPPSAIQPAHPQPAKADAHP